MLDRVCLNIEACMSVVILSIHVLLPLFVILAARLRGGGRYLVRDVAEGAVHGVIFALWQADTAVRDFLEDWAEEDPSVYPAAFLKRQHLEDRVEAAQEASESFSRTQTENANALQITAISKAWVRSWTRPIAQCRGCETIGDHRVERASPCLSVGSWSPTRYEIRDYSEREWPRPARDQPLAERRMVALYQNLDDAGAIYVKIDDDVVRCAGTRKL